MTQAESSQRKGPKEYTPEELSRAVREGRLTQRMLDERGITGAVFNPHTNKVSLSASPNDIGQSQTYTIPEDELPPPPPKRTTQQRLDSLMEKVARGMQETGALGLPDSVIEEIRLEYKWQEGKEITAEMIRAILAKYLHLETNKAEERYNKTVTYSRPSYQ